MKPIQLSDYLALSSWDIDEDVCLMKQENEDSDFEAEPLPLSPDSPTPLEELKDELLTMEDEDEKPQRTRIPIPDPLPDSPASPEPEEIEPGSIEFYAQVDARLQLALNQAGQQEAEPTEPLYPGVVSFLGRLEDGLRQVVEQGEALPAIPEEPRSAPSSPEPPPQPDFLTRAGNIGEDLWQETGAAQRLDEQVEERLRVLGYFPLYLFASI